jgi:putative ABC transport system permease protein
LVTLQGAIMGALAGFFALPLGMALAAILTLVINRRSFGWTLQLEVSFGLLLEALALAVAAAICASLLPARRAARLAVARALREE